MEGLKSLLKELKAVVTVEDELVFLNERYYIKAIVTLHDCETDEKIKNVAYAREEAEKRGMDGSQVTGAASSYARKYALNGLFAIDDTKDADTDENKKQQEKDNIPSKQTTQSKATNSKSTSQKPTEKKKEPTPPKTDGLKEIIAEIDGLAREKVKINVDKTKEAVESILGHGNYKKLTTVEDGEKIKENLSKIV